MKRPFTHEIDDLGRALLANALARLGAVNELKSDYGIDYDVEVFRNGQSTGATFKIQLKSSDATHYSASGDFVSQPVDVPNAKYLAEEMKVPTVLVHADVANERVFWTAPQLDSAVAERLRGKSDGHVTFRVPTANSLPDSVDDMLDAVARARIRLSARDIATAPPADFIAAVRDLPNIEQVLAEMRARTDAVQNEAAFQLFWANRFDESEAMLLGLLNNPTTSLDTKFAAVLILEKVEERRAIAQDMPDADRTQLGLRTAERLMTLVPGAPPYVRLYAMMTREVAKLRVLLDESWGLYLNFRIVREKRADPAWIIELAYRWAEMSDRINRKLHQCYRLANYARSPYGLVLSDPIVRLGKALILMSARFRADDQAEAEARVLDDALELFKLAAHLAWRLGDEQRVGEVIGAARVISGDENSESFRWTVAEFAKLKNEKIKAPTADLLDRLDRRKRGEELPHTIKTTIKQVYENVAKGAGIDLNDDRDPRASMVRTAIADHDPTRVLRQCEHIFITLVRDRWAERLGMASGSPKVLHCTKHGYAVEAKALDAAYGKLQSDFCSSCRDALPRGRDWQWSDETREQENVKHKEFAEAFWRKERRE